jgi:hypothetical protein
MDMAVIEGNGASNALPGSISPDLKPSKTPSNPPTMSEGPVGHAEDQTVPEHPRELPREVPKNDSTTQIPKTSKWADLPAQEH